MQFLEFLLKPSPTIKHLKQAQLLAVSYFLGVGYDPKKGSLREDRTHRAKDGFTDDVKIVDVGGRYVDIASLSPEENEVLTRFIHGVHKACAHLTAAENGLDVPTFQSAALLIQRLYEKHINTV